MSKPSLSMIYVNFQTSNEFLEIFSENVFGSVILLISRPANNPKPVMEKNQCLAPRRCSKTSVDAEARLQEMTSQFHLRPISVAGALMFLLLTFSAKPNASETFFRRYEFPAFFAINLPNSAIIGFYKDFKLNSAIEGRVYRMFQSFPLTLKSPYIYPGVL